jgi:hypothetical protein
MQNTSNKKIKFFSRIEFDHLVMAKNSYIWQLKEMPFQLESNYRVILSFLKHKRERDFEYVSDRPTFLTVPYRLLILTDPERFMTVCELLCLTPCNVRTRTQ